MQRLFLLKDIKAAILLGIGCAILVIVSGIFPFNISLLFVSIPVLFAYISYGARDGFLSMITAICIICFFCKLKIAFEIFITVLFPVSVLGHFFIKNMVDKKNVWWYPESLLLQQFALVSIFSLVIVSLTIYNEEYIVSMYYNAIREIFGNNTTDIISPHIEKLLKFSVGIGVLSKMISAVINLQIAQVIAIKLKMNIRPKFDLSGLSIPNWMAILPLVSLTIANIFPVLSFVCSGLTIVALFAPACVGLSIAHLFFNKDRRKLLIMYTIVFIFPIFGIVTFVMLGMIDSFYAIRPFLKRK